MTGDNSGWTPKIPSWLWNNGIQGKVIVKQPETDGHIKRILSEKASEIVDIVITGVHRNDPVIEASKITVSNILYGMKNSDCIPLGTIMSAAAFKLNNPDEIKELLKKMQSINWCLEK